MSDRRAQQRSNDLPWIATTATVISSEFHEAAWGQAEADGGQDVSYFVTKFTFRVKGIVYHAEERSRGVRKLGAKVAVRYDPSNPRYNTVTGQEQSATSAFWLWAMIVLGALIFLYLLRGSI